MIVISRMSLIAKLLRSAIDFPKEALTLLSTSLQFLPVDAKDLREMRNLLHSVLSCLTIIALTRSQSSK